MKNLILIFTFTTLILSYIVPDTRNKEINDHIIQTENNLKIIIGETNEKAIFDFLGQPDNIYNSIACGTTVTQVSKKTFFGKRTKNYTSASGYTISRLAYKKYGLCIVLSPLNSGDTVGKRKVTTIEIFDNTNLEVPRSKEQMNYYDGSFETLKPSTMLKIFGNSFVKYDDKENEGYNYTLTDKNLYFVFSKKDNKLVGLEIKKHF